MDIVCAGYYIKHLLFGKRNHIDLYIICKNSVLFLDRLKTCGILKLTVSPTEKWKL